MIRSRSKRIMEQQLEDKMISTAVKASEETPTKPEKPAEEWIWVKGYKGTDHDLKCRGFQFAIGDVFAMPEDAEIEDCSSGFHLCLNLQDVFEYYSIGEGRRFFQVQALVRKSDVDSYGKISGTRRGWLAISETRDKLASKAIVFLNELSVDEIFAGNKEVEGWTPEEKQLALQTSIPNVTNMHNVAILETLGYSKAFSEQIIAENKFDVAYAVGTQKDLSMDMKVLYILKASDVSLKWLSKSFNLPSYVHSLHDNVNLYQQATRACANYSAD